MGYTTTQQLVTTTHTRLCKWILTSYYDVILLLVRVCCPVVYTVFLLYTLVLFFCFRSKKQTKWNAQIVGQKSNGSATVSTTPGASGDNETLHSTHFQVKIGVDIFFLLGRSCALQWLP